ncbi:MAG: hypothetical protein R3D30_00030 [Hyphomicrobiales bacterium]
MPELLNSGFLDLTSFNSNSSVLPAGNPATGITINLALVLDRANPVADLLDANWATRQNTIAALNQNNTLWSTYGADQTKFDNAYNYLDTNGFSILGGELLTNQDLQTNQYVTSQESRTIWVQVDEAQFQTLFNQTLLETSDSKPFWNGNLSLPQELIDAGVVGLFFDSNALVNSILANPANPLPPGAVLPEGPQSLGNSGPETSEYPNEIAERYNFPFADKAFWQTVQTGTIGLLEPNIGDALPNPAPTFDELLHTFRTGAGIDPALLPSTQTIAPGGDMYVAKGERSLDVGIVTTAAPLSPLILYAGSGNADSAGGNAFTAYLQAIWDMVNNPQVISSSFSTFNFMNPDSPFYTAMAMMYEDAVLRNITMLNAAGDGGSSAEYANGLTNTEDSHANAYTLAVGGASLSSVLTAGQDDTLKTVYDKAIAGDLAVLWQLVSGGLTALPKAGSKALLIETPWNAYNVFYGAGPSGENTIADSSGAGGGYLNNEAGAGGVDITQPTPSYQIDFGLSPTTAYDASLTGRGVPDVAAVSGGNMKYTVPNPDLMGVHADAGTSGASPLWASLLSQVDTIFADQELPQLGFMNDLLYTAAVIAPGSFNDITVGNNTSSFVLGGSYLTPPPSPPGAPPSVHITPTGYGYSAGPGYDLTTGLGTPNGVLLARALTWIAHSQMSFASSPEVLTPDVNGFESPVDQSLLIQVSGPDLTIANVQTDGFATNILSTGSDPFAWTSRFAEQALQRDFARGLVRLFDHQSQGALDQHGVGTGDEVVVAINTVLATAPQATLSTDFGFVDFVADDGSQVRIARPVAVAETVGGMDDQVAVVRMRQGAKGDKGDYVLKLYRVDDFNGTIDGLKPGDDGYNAAANARAYDTIGGTTSIKGPGYLNYKEAYVVGIDAGDIVAMKLKHGNHTYFAFADANEMKDGAHVGHLWNYGLNTWGWEGGYKGGDHDFNDLVVQVDFTSAYGEGWLAKGNVFGNGNTIFGTHDADVPLNGTASSETIYGLSGADTINGDLGDDIIFGGPGADTMSGGGGADTLIGGRGKDVQFGDADADIFKFTSIKDSVRGAARDQLMDFDRAEGDQISLNRIDAKTGVAGNQAFKWIGTHDFHNVKGELRYIDKGATCIVQADVNGDGKADFEILVKVDALLKGDFIL